MCFHHSTTDKVLSLEGSSLNDIVVHCQISFALSHFGSCKRYLSTCVLSSRSEMAFFCDSFCSPFPISFQGTCLYLLLLFSLLTLHRYVKASKAGPQLQSVVLFMLVLHRSVSQLKYVAAFSFGSYCCSRLSLVEGEAL